MASAPTHFLESWGDDGPRRDDLHHPAADRADALLDQKELELHRVPRGDRWPEPGDGYSIVRATEALRSKTSGATFEGHWRAILDAGLVAGTASPMAAAAKVDAGRIAGKMAAGTLAGRGDGMDFQFLPDSSVYDGRYAGVGWLQELPDAITKITWDNALLVGPGYCIENKLSEGDMVSVTLGGRTIEAAVFPVPGMAPNTAAMALGWGRGEAAGPIGDGAGFDAYPLRTVATPDRHRHRGSDRRATYAFAQTQDHGAADALDPEVPAAGIQERLPTLVRETTLDDYKSHPDFAQHRVRRSPSESLGGDQSRRREVPLGCRSISTPAPVAGPASPHVRRRTTSPWWARTRSPAVADALAPHRPLLQGHGSDPARGRLRAAGHLHAVRERTGERVCPVAATVHDEDEQRDGLQPVHRHPLLQQQLSYGCGDSTGSTTGVETIREQEGLFAVKPDYYTSGGPDEWRRMQFNPEVTVRTRGVMEKCRSASTDQRGEDRLQERVGRWHGHQSGLVIPDGVIKTATAGVFDRRHRLRGSQRSEERGFQTLRQAGLVSASRGAEHQAACPLRRPGHQPGGAARSDDHHGDHGHDHDGGHAAAATTVAEGVRA